ncbi:MAG TPA: hypothetical protein DEA96_17535 [Leptospiraceae bacterium]|nr:hypothetical protein [Spirochaetaceae bacterium]HBS06776.1 hypothetical protein [Leptospiraceae bacterium]
MIKVKSMQALGLFEILIILVLVALLYVPPLLLSNYIARRKAQSIPLALGLTLCLSWIGVIIVALMPDANPRGQSNSSSNHEEMDTRPE